MVEYGIITHINAVSLRKTLHTRNPHHERCDACMLDQHKYLNLWDLRFTGMYKPVTLVSVS